GSPPPAWTGFRPLRVAQRNSESSSVVSFELQPGDGHSLAIPLPGQFIVLRLHPRSRAPVLRSYSLSSSPKSDCYRISVKLEPNGAASAYFKTQSNIGDLLETSAPRGSFTLRPGDGPVVLLSAGIGATPVMAMLHALADENSQREVWWLFGARNKKNHPFAQEARSLLEALPHGRSHIQYSRPDPDDRLGPDYDAPGRFDVTVLKKLGVPRTADFYLCGPPGFLNDLMSGLASWGVDVGHIHTEIFGPGKSSTPGVINAPHPPPHQPAALPDSGPSISFARSGLTTRWSPAFHNLLELAEACDVPVKWSCRTGVCHSCESGLIAGSVSYDPKPLEPAADGNLLICCSQPLTDLIIDL
ncbi:MAG: 2Fe-2S iron-sulfur cluster binding domain-containing protein, partial [Acidobacteriota bacterium]|nr:2Fe-2S iron-sulfur cluster binding domain-containing protein [Acidobacteriota bacterium]